MHPLPRAHHGRPWRAGGGELQVRTVPSFLAVKMCVPPGVTVQIGFGARPRSEESRIAGWNGNAGSGAGYGRLIAWEGEPMTNSSDAAEVRRAHRTELSPLRFLERSVLVYPDKVAVVHEDRRYTYREFGERVNRLASALRAAGLRKGDRVAFICPNIPALLEAHYGVPPPAACWWR